MAGEKRTSAKITPEALERLRALPAQVQSRFGVSATQEVIVSALVLEITVPQLVGILMGYHQDHAPSPATDDEET
jgi:hypothetical protein